MDEDEDADEDGEVEVEVDGEVEVEVEVVGAVVAVVVVVVVVVVGSAWPGVAPTRVDTVDTRATAAHTANTPRERGGITRDRPETRGRPVMRVTRLTVPVPRGWWWAMPQGRSWAPGVPVEAPTSQFWHTRRSSDPRRPPGAQPERIDRPDRYTARARHARLQPGSAALGPLFGRFNDHHLSVPR